MSLSDAGEWKPREWILWGSELSPFALKVEALLRFAKVPRRWIPAGGGFLEAVRYHQRRFHLVAGRLPLTWPKLTELDELPLVPFLFGPAGENLYDSTAIAGWLDQRLAATPGYDPLIPVAASCTPRHLMCSGTSCIS